MPYSQYSVSGISDTSDGTSPVDYRIGQGGKNSVGSPSGSGTTIDVKPQSLYGSATGSLSVKVGTTYWLQVQNNSGTWINTDSASVGSCARSSGSASCTTYSHVLQPHANYRFTVFPTTSVSVTGPSPTSVTGSTPGSWATYTVGSPYSVAYQAYLNSNNKYSDSYGSYTPSGSPASGTFNLTYPPPSGPDWVVLVESWTYDSTTNTSTYGSRMEGPQILYPGTNCYAATCTISVAGDLPGGGSNDVESGTTYGATATITNTGMQPLQSIGWAGNANANGNLSQTISIGSGATTAIDMNPPPLAPTPQGTYTVGGTVYYGSYGVAGCSPANIDVFQHFTLTPYANAQLSPTTEDPTQVTNNTWAVEGGPAPTVSEPVNSELYEITSTGVRIPMGSPSSLTSDGPYNTGVQTYIYNNYTYNIPVPPVLEAGDQFCAETDVSVSSGWVDQSNDVVADPADTAGAPNPTATDCPTVVNQPFFKVYNGGVSAGSSIPAPGTSTCNGGEVASWNNNTGTYPNSGDYGAGAQLHALAAYGITGFASSQNLPPTLDEASTNLSFANNGVSLDTDLDSPAMGGDFGNTPCLTPPQATASTTDEGSLSSTSIGALDVGPGQHSYSFGSTSSPVNLTLNGGVLGVGDNMSIFVNGNVYITASGINGIIYAGDSHTSGSGAVWNSTADIPSFSLDVTGNIYIDPGVTELDGIYTAQPASSSSGGTIYTCSAGTGQYVDGTFPTGTPFSPMAANELFDNCKNQLLVYGNFTANKVSLMRTFGSLRDETPTPAVTHTVGGNPGANAALIWNHDGGINDGGQGGNYATAGLPCTQIQEPSEPASNTWQDNYLCLPPADQGAGGVSLTWIYAGVESDTAWAEADSGQPYCTSDWGDSIDAGPWDYPGQGIPGQYYWQDDYLCSNYPVSFVIDPAGNPTTQGQLCTLVNEPADTDGHNIWNSGGTYVCIAAAQGSVSTTTPAMSNVASPCSNNGVQETTETCAAEVFELSPEIYLSKWSINPPSNGALQYQAITSLPPIL